MREIAGPPWLRRAAAVKNALAKKFGIDPARLTPEGFGESRPRGSNDTLYGRARNRRVELVRALQVRQATGPARR